MQSVPDLLYHRINGGNTYNYEEDVAWALGQIKEEGLVPDIARAWANLVPEHIRDLPIVWLTEQIGKRSGNGYAQWLEIRTDGLVRSRLYKLDISDVNWWVYQGVISFDSISIRDCV